MSYKYLKDFIEPNFDINRPVMWDLETMIPRDSKSRAAKLALYGDIRLWQVAQDGICYIYDCNYIDENILKEYFKEYHLVGHNIIYDCTTAKWQPKDIDCTLYLGKHSDPTLDSFSLKSLLENYEIGKKTNHGADDWSVEELTEDQLLYAANDTIYLEKLYNKIKWAKKDFQSYRLDILNLKHSLNYQLNGFPVRESNRLAFIEKEKKNEDLIKMCLPQDLNVNSPKQVKAFLETTSSAADILSEMALHGNKDAESILDLRQSMKRLNFLEQKFCFDRVYGIFNPTGAKSSRFTCKGNGHTKASQNLQQLPYLLKNVFGFEDNNDSYLVDADYTALEIHTAACMMNETIMINIMKKGGDLHYETASMIYDKPISEVTKHERKMGKGLNFSLLYGAGPVVAQTFIQQIAGLKVPLDEVTILRKKWLSAYPSISNYHKKVGERFQDRSFLVVKTPLGKPVKANSYTEAINVPCQGAGAECTKLAIKLLYERLPKAKIVNTVHDSITLEVRGLEESKRQAKILKSCMDDSWLLLSRFLPVKDLVMDNLVEVTKVYEGDSVWSTEGLKLAPSDKIRQSGTSLKGVSKND